MANRGVVGVLIAFGAGAGVLLANLADDIARSLKFLGTTSDDVPVPRPFVDDVLPPVGSVRETAAARALREGARSAMGREDPVQLLSFGTKYHLLNSVSASDLNDLEHVRVVVRNAAEETAREAAKKPWLNVKFEVATGNVSIGSDRSIGRSGNLSIGYRVIPLYETSAAAATLLYACAQRSSDRKLDSCYDAAMERIWGKSAEEAKQEELRKQL